VTGRRRFSLDGAPRIQDFTRERVFRSVRGYEPGETASGCLR
jgi:hypothetical protein